jgi:hypothetical protein
MKILVPKASWSAVAAATAFLPPSLAPLPYEPKAESGSCCYRTPRRCAHFHHRWCVAGAWASVRKGGKAAKKCDSQIAEIVDSKNAAVGDHRYNQDFSQLRSLSAQQAAKPLALTSLHLSLFTRQPKGETRGGFRVSSFLFRISSFQFRVSSFLARHFSLITAVFS